MGSFSTSFELTSSGSKVLPFLAVPKGTDSHPAAAVQHCWLPSEPGLKPSRGERLTTTPTRGLSSPLALHWLPPLCARFCPLALGSLPCQRRALGGIVPRFAALRHRVEAIEEAIESLFFAQATALSVLKKQPLQWRCAFTWNVRKTWAKGHELRTKIERFWSLLFVIETKAAGRYLTCAT